MTFDEIQILPVVKSGPGPQYGFYTKMTEH